tara:strand:- start:728 stop:1084 length:357 start_codon:yes stop_codon:yes gene_type:complete
MEIDKKIILRLIQTLEDLKKSLKGIEINYKEESAIEEIEISGTVVKSPIVGTVYLAPEPGGKKFLELGKKIKKGDTIMIVEAMKTMNHVPSPLDGIVKEISVEDGQPVEFGQKLITLE